MMTMSVTQNQKWIHPSEESTQECADWFAPILDVIGPGWIAGGALRDYFSRTKCNSDIDVFFDSMESLEQGRKAIESVEAWKLRENEGVIQYQLGENTIEFIKHRFFESIEETIAEFDFTVCCAAVDQWGRVIVHPNFFEDLAYRRLMLNRISFPVGTLARLPKYMEKGFKPDSGLMLELAKAMREIDFDDPGQNKLQFYRSGEQRYGRFRDAGFCGDDEAA